MLREAKGNMYAFVTHTWNALKGKCSHDCLYCYMKIFNLKALRLDQREFDTNMGSGNFIFVGSSCDMFAEDVPEDWIIKTLNHCKKYQNRYLFQSKNPKRIYALKEHLPENSVIGTTIETNRLYKEMGKTPSPEERAKYINEFSKEKDYETMVTIEPIFNFDIDNLTHLIDICNPSWVNVGADSKGHKLPEPSKEGTLDLIERLKQFTDVKIKNNLKRIIK